MSYHNNALESYINNKDMTMIYNHFCNIILQDPVFLTKKFDITLEYVNSKIPDLIKHFEGKDLDDNKDHWDSEYWQLIVWSLMDNFCQERIAHIKEIAHHLSLKEDMLHKTTECNESVKVYKVSDNKTKTENKQSTSANHGNDFTKKIIPIAVTAGAALVCLATLAIGSKKIAAAVWIVAIAAGAYAVLKKEE